VDITNINLNLYKSFIVACETRNLHRAAEVMNLTREAIRHNIKELSRQLGIVLFNPHRKGIEPTADAVALYREVKPALETITRAEQTLMVITPQTHGTIKMVVKTLFAESFLNDYIKVFRAKYPNIAIEFYYDKSLELLRNNKIDFVINWDCLFRDTEFKIIKIVEKGFDGGFVATQDFLNEYNLTVNLSKEDLIKLPIAEGEEFVPIIKEMLGTDQLNIIKASESNTIFSIAGASLAVAYCVEMDHAALKKFNFVNLNVAEVSPFLVHLVCGYKNLSRVAHVFLDGLVKYIKHKV